MKKILIILSALFVVLFFSACGVSGIVDIIDVLEILFVTPLPVSGSIEIETNLVLSWNVETTAEDEIVSYSIYLDQNPNPTTLRGTTGNKSFNINGLDYATTYYWKIVANHNSGVSVPGSVWRFTTKDEPVFQGQLRGITIGVTNYGGGGNNLDYPDDDAMSIETTFKNLENAFTIQKQTGTVTKNQILNWLNTYVENSSSNDVFLFQFSGHGDYYNGKSWLILSDGSELSSSELKTTLNEINGTKIVLIDACFSGDFTNMSQGRILSKQERIEQTELFNHGVIEAFAESAGTRGEYESNYEYYVLTGAADNEYANEDVDLKHGFFTFFFTDGLGNVGESNYNDAFDFSYDADGYGPGGVLNGRVTYKELYHYSKDKVQGYINSNYPGEIQTIQGNHINDDFVIGIY